MQLDKQAVDEFISLYKKKYGITLSRLQAVEYGDRLVHLVRAVYGNYLPKQKKIDKAVGEADN